MTQNFVVLKTYNNSDADALAGAHLADRAERRGPVPQRLADQLCPTVTRRAHRAAESSQSWGYKVTDFDGHFDFDLRDDIRKLQLSYGMTPDGHPSLRLLPARPPGP